MSFYQQFSKLDQALTATRQWWQFAAFHPLQSRWQSLAPKLHRALNDARVGYADFNPQHSATLETCLHETIPQLAELQQCTRLVRRAETINAPNAHWQYQIAGRKWTQISHFAAHTPEQQHLLEWCAGKGHLGRFAASRGAKSLTSIEWQQSLCEKNQALNARLHIDIDHCRSAVVCCDVLSDQLADNYQAHHFAIALHACGDLHTHLVRQTVQRQAQGLCLAPCCYNLIANPIYQPLSRLAADSALKLSKLDLSLPLRQLITAGAREQREQRQERLWRIAFDCHQRQVRGVDEYLPLPTIPKAILKGQFADFIQWAAERKSLNDLAQFQLEKLLQEAELRLPAIAQMEWVQNQFQRALEIWLLLEQILFLEENHYQCELFEFCDEKDTPRNLMIRAVRVDALSDV